MHPSLFSLLDRTFVSTLLGTEPAHLLVGKSHAPFVLSGPAFLQAGLA